jgi:translocation and assembly module TamB
VKKFKWLLRGFLAISLIVLSGLLFLTGTETGLQWLIYTTRTLSGGILTVGSGSGTLLHSLHLRQIRYADGINTFQIESLELSWLPWELFKGQLHVQALRSTTIRIDLGESESESSGETVLTPVTLPIGVVVDAVAIDDFALSSGKEELQRLQTANLTNLVYQGQDLKFADCTITSDTFTIRAQGSLRTDAQYVIDGGVDAKLRLQEYGTIAATARVSGPLNHLDLTADLHAPVSIHLKSELRDLLGSAAWNATITSPEIQLPQINPQWPDQRFRNLTIQGNGSLQTYSLAVTAKAGLPELEAPVSLDVKLHGTDQGLELTRCQLTQGQATLTALGTLQWLPELAWKADIQGKQLDPSVFLPEWPGDLAIELSTKGQMAQSLQATAQLSALKGTLRNYPLSGTGEVEINGQHLTIPRFQLNSGGSTLSVTGSSAQKLDLAVLLKSSNLAELWPGAHGRLDARVNLRGRPAQPDIDLQLTASDLQLDQNRIKHLTVTGKGSLDPQRPLNANIVLKQVVSGEGIQLDKGLLDLQGTLAKHTLNLLVNNDQFSTGFMLQGSYAEDQWRGTLGNSRFSSTEWGNWSQKKPSALVVSPTQAELRQICLTDSKDTSLCVDGGWLSSDGSWQIRSELSSLSLSLLNHTLPSQWAVQGTLNSTIRLQGRQQGITSAKVSCETQNLLITAPLADGTPQKLAWKSNTLRADFSNEQLRLTFNSSINDRNSLRADLRQTTKDLAGDLLKRPIEGKLLLDLQDLGLLALFSNQAVIPSGKLQGQWNIAGPLLTPRFSGKMALVDGKAEIPALGITLSPLQLTMQGDSNTMNVTASARSGEGELTATSSINLAHPNRQQIRVMILGNNFTAAKLPNMYLVLSPDLTLDASDKRLDVQGRVTIPKAKITSIDYEQATAPSNDVIVVDDTAYDVSSTSLPLHLALDIILGKDVHVDAYGLLGDIDGNLKVEGQPGRPQTGIGTLNVTNGSFTLYGKRLKITVGRLLFTGGPLNNPAIELRSENKTERATTGVTIEGFLQRPEISFYSTPAMEQAAIVNNLLQDTAIGGETREDVGVFGTAAEKIGLGGLVPYLRSLKKFSMIDEIKLEGGDNYEDASLVFGSWLTPDFYVSYGKGMAEESGSFNTKLNLGKGFSLLTETGSDQSGGDIKYEFEH